MELSDINKQFAAKVKEIRKNLGLNQKDFGYLLKIHKQQISRYERGISLPRREIRERILAYDQPKEVTSLMISEPKDDWIVQNPNSEKRRPDNTQLRNFINRVIRILRSGNNKAITALESNVDAFLEMVEGKKPSLEGGD